MVDAQERFVSVNPAVRPILGWSPEQFISMGLAELVHPDDQSGHARRHCSRPRMRTPRKRCGIWKTDC